MTILSNVTETFPAQAASALMSNPKTRLVDVRTRPEWAFVGLPDLSESGNQPILLEWQVFPDMQVRQDFAQLIAEQVDLGQTDQIYFLCRSGVRSLAAAHEVAHLANAMGQTVDCVNIIGGFEGDLDAQGHRGNVNGWKHAGLAWQQR